MATITLDVDCDIDDLSVSDGTYINLNGHVLTVQGDKSSIRVAINGTGTVLLLDGGYLNASYSTFSGNAIIKAGSEHHPLPPIGNHGFPFNASAALLVPNSLECKIITKCLASGANWTRNQFAKVSSASGTTVVLDRDMGLRIGDVVGFNRPTSQTYDPNSAPSKVIDYDASTNTVVLDSLPLTPQFGSQCVLLTCSFALVYNGSVDYPHGAKGCISGDEIGFYPVRQRWGSLLNGRISVRRIVSSQQQYQYESLGFGPTANVSCDIYISTGGAGSDFSCFSCDIGKAYCASFASSYDNRGTPRAGAGIVVRGGDVSVFPCQPYGRAEYVDTIMPSSLYSTLADTSELVIRTTNPETCVIHRAGGIATLVKRGGGDAVMANAPVSDAYQLAPTGLDAVWHDLPVTVEPGKKLTIAWQSFCAIGVTAGVQILADLPLFGQVAVGMGIAETLAEHTESSPAPGAWNPSRLLSWRNTGDSPARVWVRGWGQGGTVYSNVQVVKGGTL